MSESIVNSEPKERTPEQKAKWAAYIRSYRKRKKLAAGHLIAIGSSNPAPEAKSSPTSPPDWIGVGKPEPLLGGG